jgi:hypothetical protein
MSHPEPEESSPHPPILFLSCSISIAWLIPEASPKSQALHNTLQHVDILWYTVVSSKMEDHPLLAVLQLPQLHSSWETLVCMLKVQNFVWINETDQVLHRWMFKCWDAKLCPLVNTSTSQDHNTSFSRVMQSETQPCCGNPKSHIHCLVDAVSLSTNCFVKLPFIGLLYTFTSH